MKDGFKYLAIFLIFCLAAFIYLLYPFKAPGNFVLLEDGKFKLNGKDFYPVVVNYKVSMRADEKNFWPCPYLGYTPDSLKAPWAKDSCLMQLKADLELIREMGFNAIRVVGIGEETIGYKTGELTISARKKDDSDTTLVLASDSSYKTYLNAVGQLFELVNEAGLKTIFLVRLRFDSTFTDHHLRMITSRFKDDTSLMAYDLFNEPLYFDSVWYRTKEEAIAISKKWNRIQKMYAPHHLSTIGLSNVREVFRWDPNMLDVDFISFHPYNHEPELVMNELHWYGKYVTKPWIIGETAISADNDSVSYEDQKAFAEKTLKQAYNCGAKGYSWWQYKDVDWKAFMANYMGVVTRRGKTITAKSKLTVQGTVKPVTEAFKKFNPSAEKDSCICLPNYHNYSQGKSYRLSGYMTDADNMPINGGVVLAWDNTWVHSCHTFTKKDGSFELLSEFPFSHWIASATMYSTERGEISSDTAKKAADSIPTQYLKPITLRKLNL